MKRADRFWRWLGFRLSHAPVPEEWGPDFHRSTAVFPLGWRDRLRILVGGIPMVDFAHQIYPFPMQFTSTCELTVLPPRSKLVGPVAAPPPMIVVDEFDAGELDRLARDARPGAISWTKQ